jgi:hypothetical protein
MTDVTRKGGPPDAPGELPVAEAFRALDETIRDGYFDDFSSRVLARLHEEQLVGPEEEREPKEVDAMEGQRDFENSGLHEIKALASMTKRRLSQKITSQQEAEDSMLAGASSRSFKAVALPDPGRERPVVRARATEPPPVATAVEGLAREAPPMEARTAYPAAPVARMTAPRVAASLAGDLFTLPKKPGHGPMWLLGGVAALAAAAAVAVFVFGIGRDQGEGKGGPDEAATAIAQAEQAPASEPVLAEAPPATPDPAPAALPVVSPLDGEEEPADEAERSAGHGALAAASPRASRREAGDRDRKRDDSGVESKRSAAVPSAGSTADAKEKKGGAIEGLLKKSSSGGGTQDLGDMLDQVTGGVEAPVAAQAEENAKPSKKELDRRDVTNAMAKVRGAALKCREVEQFDGTVTVKFTVDPSGKVSAAKASKEGLTGDCVAGAVKRAVFPSFDGAPTSFSYPFLLAD